ncbi:MAG: PKD domain-containing protein [Nitrospirae bacterium]|nr:PKD domain-containing protein [Nitrospirota bacterium]
MSLHAGAPWAADGTARASAPRSIAIMLGAVGWLCVAPGAFGAGTFYIDGANPACSNTGPGTASTPYCAISAAASAQGGPGTTLYVGPAVYREQVTVPASGASGSPFVFQALGPGVVVDGADDLSSTAKWTWYVGDVWLATSVTWSALQVFVDGARLTASGATPDALPARSFRYIAGTGLYVNAGGGNPGGHQALVGHRANGFVLSGKSWVTIDGFTVTRTEDRAIYLYNFLSNDTVTHNAVTFANRYGIAAANASALVIGSNVVADNNDHGIAFTTGVTGSTIEDNESFRNARPAVQAGNGLYLWASSGNRVQRNRFHDNKDAGLQIRAASDNTVSVRNRSWNNGDHGYSDLGVSGTLHVGDVAWGNYRDGFSVVGTSPNTTIVDCVSVNNGPTTSRYDLEVDATSVTGFLSNRNIIWNGTSQVPIKYGGATYATLAAFTAATGQDAQSIQDDPRFVDPSAGNFHLRAGSPAIDSADSSVPNWPPTDAAGRAPVDDPATANAGVGPMVYADRNVLEFIPPQAVVTVTPASGTAPLTVTADASASGGPDAAIVSYQFDFGDGTVVGPQAGATATHTYAPGTWTASVAVTDSAGGTASATTAVTATNQAPNGVINDPAGNVAIAAGQSVSFAGTGTDPDNHLPLTYQWDFGGGAPNQTVEDPGSVVFATPGTYTVTFTVTDALGLSDPTPDNRVVTVSSVVVPVDEIHWTLTGQTSVTFDWRGSDNTIRYGLTSGYGQTVTAQTPDPLPFSSSGPFWEAKITGLAENTVYHYSIGGGSDHTFHTPLPRGASGFTVYVEGDIGDTGSYWRMGVVQSEIAADPPAFVLPIGDLTYGNAHGQSHVDQHFNDVMLWSLDAAYMPAWGNHEWDEVTDDLRNYKGRFDLPNPQVSPGSPAVGCCGEDWYWFDYGNVRFIAYPEPWDRPATWADWNTKATVLMDAAQADPSIAFIVTFGHRPAYSSGHHPGESKLKAFLDALGANHGKYVLNLNAHSHNYERTFPQSGVVHVTTGGGGSGLEEDPVGTCLWKGGCPPPSWSAFRAMHHGPLKLRFTAVAIEGQAICGPSSSASVPNDVTCAEGSVMDSFVISPDQPPNGVIDSPAGDVTVMAGESVTFTGTGSDPDGNLPLTYRWNFGGAAASQNVEDPGPVVLNNPGTFTVTLTVTDALGLSDQTPDTRVITVTGSDEPPLAVLTVTPSTGNEPLSVTADASASSDPDGTIVSYRFDFGDGTIVGPQTSPTATHVYSAGTWTAGVTVVDNDSGSAWTSLLVTVAAVGSGANLVGNPSFESDTSGWRAYGGSTIQRISGGFDGMYSLEATGPASTATFGVDDLPNWVGATPAVGTRYRFTAWVRSAGSTGTAQLRVREYQGTVKVGTTAWSPTVVLSPSWQMLTVDYVAAYAGSTLDLQITDTPVTMGEVFQTDNISIRIVP